MSTQFAFLSIRYGVAWPSRQNCTEEKEESIIISTLIFLLILLKRIKLVSQRIYVNLCKYQPIDVFVMYIFQSFTRVKEHFHRTFPKFYLFSQKLDPMLQVYGQSYEKNPTDLLSDECFALILSCLLRKQLDPFHFLRIYYHHYYRRYINPAPIKANNIF